MLREKWELVWTFFLNNNNNNSFPFRLLNN
jgi:hypothetical protein